MIQIRRTLVIAKIKCCDAGALLKAVINKKPVDYFKLGLDQYESYYSNSESSEYICSGVFAILLLGFSLS